MNDSRCLSRLESARVGITMVAPVVELRPRATFPHPPRLHRDVGAAPQLFALEAPLAMAGLEHQEAGAAHPTEATQPDRVRRDLEAAVRVRDDLAQVVQAREGSMPRRPRPESARPSWPRRPAPSTDRPTPPMGGAGPPRPPRATPRRARRQRRAAAAAGHPSTTAQPFRFFANHPVQRVQASSASALL